MQPFTSDKDLLRAAVQGVEPTDHVGDLAPVLRLIDPYIAPAGSPAGDPKSAASGGSGAPGVPGAGGPDRSPFTSSATANGPAAKTCPSAAGTCATCASPVPMRTSTTWPSPCSPPGAMPSARSAPRSTSPSPITPPSDDDPYHPQPRRPAPRGGQCDRPALSPRLTPPPEPPALPDPSSSPPRHPRPGRPGRGRPRPHDQLAADDHAAMLLAPPSQVQVMLITTGNGFLERALRSAMVRKLVIRTPAEYENEDPHHLRRGAGGSEDGFDLIVFDGFSPSHVPPVNSLYLGAAPPLPGVARLGPGVGEPRVQELLNWDQRHPLMQHVEMKYLPCRPPATWPCPVRRGPGHRRCRAGHRRMRRCGRPPRHDRLWHPRHQLAYAGKFCHIYL